MIRTVEAALPILGRVQLELEPRAAGVALRASTTLLRAPEAVLTADECMTLARELLAAAARSMQLAGAYPEAKAGD